MSKKIDIEIFNDTIESDDWIKSLPGHKNEKDICDSVTDGLSIKRIASKGLVDQFSDESKKDVEKTAKETVSVMVFNESQKRTIRAIDEWLDGEWGGDQVGETIWESPTGKTFHCHGTKENTAAMIIKGVGGTGENAVDKLYNLGYKIVDNMKEFIVKKAKKRLKS